MKSSLLPILSYFLICLSHGSSYVTSMPFLSTSPRAHLQHRHLQPSNTQTAAPSMILSSTRGGALRQTSSSSSSSKCPITGIATALTSLWGVGGVVYILAKAIRRVLPIALEPFQEGAVALSNLQLGCVVGTVVSTNEVAVCCYVPAACHSF